MSCGYQGHVCGARHVQFISRYRGTNDYCVNGNRVSLNDTGEFGESTPSEREAIVLYELDQYASYLRWRGQVKKLWNGFQPKREPFPYASACQKRGGGDPAMAVIWVE